MQFVPDGTEVEFTVQRGDAEARTVRLKPTPTEGAFVASRGFWFEPIERIRKAESFAEQVRYGWDETSEALTMVFRFLKKLGTQVPISTLGGPGTIAKAAGYSAAEGMSSLLIFLTMLSANLAVINFLPIPLLDGGHLVFLAYEGIRGRPANEKFVVALHTVGFVFIVSLMLYVIALDLGVRFRGTCKSSANGARKVLTGLVAEVTSPLAADASDLSTRLGAAGAAADDALLHVGLQHAEGLLVALDRHVQRLQHPLGREVVGDDPLLDFDRLGRHAERLRVEAEVENQLFGRARDAAEIRVQADGVLIVHFHLHAGPLHLLLSGWAGGWFAVGSFLIGHDDSPCVEELC